MRLIKQCSRFVVYLRALQRVYSKRTVDATRRQENIRRRSTPINLTCCTRTLKLLLFCFISLRYFILLAFSNLLGCVCVFLFIYLMVLTNSRLLLLPMVFIRLRLSECTHCWLCVIYNLSNCSDAVLLAAAVLMSACLMMEGIACACFFSSTLCCRTCTYTIHSHPRATYIFTQPQWANGSTILLLPHYPTMHLNTNIHLTVCKYAWYCSHQNTTLN